MAKQISKIKNLLYWQAVDNPKDDFLSSLPGFKLRRGELKQLEKSLAYKLKGNQFMEDEHFRGYLHLGGVIMLNTQPLFKDDSDYFFMGLVAVVGGMPYPRIRLTHETEEGLELLTKKFGIPYNPKMVIGA